MRSPTARLPRNVSGAPAATATANARASPLRVASYVGAGAPALAIAGGIYFHLQGNAEDAALGQIRGPGGAYLAGTESQYGSVYSRLVTDRNLSYVFVGVAGAAAVGAVVLFFTSGTSSGSSSSAAHVRATSRGFAIDF